MTEIANRGTGAELTTNGGGITTPATLSANDGVIQLQEWAQELNAAHQLGAALAASSFLPMSLRKKGKTEFKNMQELTNDAAAVILAGKSVGLDPMQSVQNIFPVHGMPSMYARTMVALVISAGHEAVRSAAADDSVTYKVRRKGGEWQEFTWTIRRAQKAGYTANDKYAKDPIAMLGAKAAAEACRVVFPDVLLGMAYSVEDLELEDMGEDAPPAADAPAAEPTKRNVARKPRAAAPTPDLPPVVNDAPRDEPEPEPTPEPAQAQDSMCSTSQQKALGEALKVAGHATKAEMMHIVSSWAGREITASRELTVTEATELTNEIRDSIADKAADTATGEISDPTADPAGWGTNMEANAS